MVEGRTIVVIGDDVRLRIGLKAYFEAHWRLRCELRLDGLDLREVDRHRAIIVDLSGSTASFGDLAILAKHRMSVSRLPIVALAGTVDAALVNALNLIRVELIVRRHEEPNLRALASRLWDEDRFGSAPLQSARSQYGLSEREHEIVIAAMADCRRSAIARSLGVSEETVKSHVSALLQKVPYATFRQFVYELQNRSAR